jgi:hypothetical protein
MPLPIPHDIEQIIVQVVAHLILDIVTLRPIHHAPPRDDVEHGPGGFPGVCPHVGTRRDGREMLFDRMIESDGGIIGAQMLGHIIVPGTDGFAFFGIKRAPTSFAPAKPLRSAQAGRGEPLGSPAKDDVFRKAWAACDTFRGLIDASEYNPCLRRIGKGSTSKGSVMRS